MPMVSYAQNHEDVLLSRLFAAARPGFYIDVGANDPAHDSVTRHFYEMGWRGVNVEPGPIYKKLAAERPRDANLNVAVSNRSGSLTFYEFPAAGGFSTLCQAEADRHRRERGFECLEHQVPVTTLAAICEQYAMQPIDFLSIDVEGHERQVLEGADWSRWRPTAVVIEATRPNTPIPVHEEWEGILLGADYLWAAFDGLNRYYIRAEDSHLLPKLAAPANVFDNFLTYSHLRHMADMATGYRAQIASLERVVQELSVRCEEYGNIGPTTMSIVRRLHGLSRRFPRLKRGLKRILRRAA